MSREYLKQSIIPVGSLDANFGIFVEDFSFAKQGAKAGTGTDYEVSLDPTGALRGSCGLKLQTKTTTPADNDYVSYTQIFGVVLSQFMEFLVFVKFPSIASNFTFDFVVSVPSGADVHGLQFGAQIILSSLAIKVLTGSATFTAVDTISQLAANDWNILQVGIDRISQKYVTLRWNHEDFDPSANSVHDEGAVDNTMDFTPKLTVNAATQRACYIDNILIRSELS